LSEELENKERLLAQYKEHEQDLGSLSERNLDLVEENKVFFQRFSGLEPILSEKEAAIERLEVTKETLEIEKETLSHRIMDLEKRIREKTAEVRGNSLGGKRMSSGLTDLLRTERELNAGHQKEIQKLRQNISDLMSKNCPDQKVEEIFKEELGRREKDKWKEERKKIVADLQKNIDRAVEVENQLEQARETCKNLESYMTDGERALKKKTDVLERNLEQLTHMYQQLINQKSTLGVDAKLSEKKFTRVSDRNKGLEAEYKKLNNLIEQAEAKIGASEEMTSSQRSSKVINSGNIKKTIKGGVPGSKRPSVVVTNEN